MLLIAIHIPFSVLALYKGLLPKVLRLGPGMFYCLCFSICAMNDVCVCVCVYSLHVCVRPITSTTSICMVVCVCVCVCVWVGGCLCRCVVQVCV